MSNANLDITKELRLISIKKYWKHIEQVKIELNWLYDKILVLATFMKDLRRIYNNKKVIKIINNRYNIDSK